LLKLSEQHEAANAIIASTNLLSAEIVGTLHWLLFVLNVVKGLSILNMFFLAQQLIMVVFQTRLKRQFEFPSIQQILDAAIFVSSLIMITWLDTSISTGLPVLSEATEAEFDLVLIENFTTNLGFKFQYLFSLNIMCLFVRIGWVIQFNPSIGPLLKILAKMANDFINFVTIYLILVIMFSVVGNLNFLFDCPEYSTLFDSFIFVVDCSMGNFDFGVFEEIENERLRNIGKAYLLALVVFFALLILNLIIAILSNTYNHNEPMSNGLFLSQILQARDDLKYDEVYGSFLVSLTPLNFITFPFVPYAIFRGSSERLNNFVMQMQYIILQLLMFFLFLLISILLLPLAFLKISVRKT